MDNKGLWYLGENHTVDMVLFNEAGDKLLLIQRAGEPFKDCFALPGGFVDTSAPKGASFVLDKETPEEAALRELQEETVIQKHQLQIHTLHCIGFFDDASRDPRNSDRAKAVSWGFFVQAHGEPEPLAQDDAKAVEWVPVQDVRLGKIALAFDHQQIIDTALEFKHRIDIQQQVEAHKKESFSFAFKKAGLSKSP